MSLRVFGDVAASSVSCRVATNTKLQSIIQNFDPCVLVLHAGDLHSSSVPPNQSKPTEKLIAEPHSHHTENDTICFSQKR